MLPRRARLSAAWRPARQAVWSGGPLGLGLAVKQKSFSKSHGHFELNNSRQRHFQMPVQMVSLQRMQGMLGRPSICLKSERSARRAPGRPFPRQMLAEGPGKHAGPAALKEPSWLGSQTPHQALCRGRRRWPGHRALRPAPRQAENLQEHGDREPGVRACLRPCTEPCVGRAGAGPGIERFVPRRGKLEISKNMVIENLACVLDLPPETLEAVAGTPAAEAGADAAAARTAWRPWTVEEMEAGEREPPPLRANAVSA